MKFLITNLVLFMNIYTILQIYVAFGIARSYTLSSINNDPDPLGFVVLLTCYFQP